MSNQWILWIQQNAVNDPLNTVHIQDQPPELQIKGKNIEMVNHIRGYLLLHSTRVKFQINKQVKTFNTLTQVTHNTELHIHL